MKKMYLSYILFLALQLFSQQVYFSWDEIKSPINGSIKFLRVNSINDFIVTSREGEVYKYLDGKWLDLHIESELKLNPFLFFDADSVMHCAAVDQKWHTHFFMRINGAWKKYKYVHPNPIISLFSANNKVFAFGSWGSLLELNKDDWSAIDTPFENHIHQVTVDNDGNIWMAVLSEDIFMYNHKTFYSYPFRDDIKSNFYGMRTLDNNIIEVIADDSNVYQLKDDQFEKRGKLLPYEWSQFTNKEFGFRETVILTDSGGKISVKIPVDFKFNDYKFSTDTTIFLTNVEGKVLIGRPAKIPQFVNLAETYKVAGSPTSNTIGAAIIDINSDDYPDLFTLNGHGYEYSNFFINNPNEQFTDGSSSFKVLLGGYASNFAVYDFNNDGLRDFIYSGQDSIGNYIEILENVEFNKFEKLNRIDINKKLFKRNINNINVFDYDGDGDLDINGTEYYGNIFSNRGGELFFKNTWLGDKFEIDTTFLNITNGWNIQSVFADFDGDDKNELYIANDWAKNKLLFSRDNKWINEADKRFKNLVRDECQGAAAFDYDNDGDLDILTLSDTLFFSLFENNGHGYFNEASSKVGLDKIYSPYIQRVSKRNICLADINNDGFVDIFVTLDDQDLSRNYLLINNRGKYFSDRAIEYGVEKPVVNGMVAGDIDNDGDIDLFAFSSGQNLLWINTTDNKNFIKIKLRGTGTNSLGISAKVWLYEVREGNKILHAYKQVGSDVFGRNQFNDETLHFGVENNKNYKAIIKFYNGKTVETNSISPGSTLKINEHGKTTGFIINLPEISYRFFRQEKIQFNILLYMATIAVIYFGILFGIRKFNWTLKNAFFIGAIHLFLFWVIYISVSDSQIAFIKYLVPLIVLTSGLVFTNVGYYWSFKVSQKKSAGVLSDELLSLLRNFTHGEWAARNLNSLILFFKNWSPTEDEGYKSQVGKRIGTYRQLTKDNILKIIELSDLAVLGSVNSTSLTKLVQTIDSELENFEIVPDKEISASLAIKFEQLKLDLTDLKSALYRRYTCDPESVIVELLSTYEDEFILRNIQCEFKKEYTTNPTALIKAYELADILDNLFSNAIHAFTTIQEKKIIISIKRKAPKILIRVKNNGRVIDKADHNKIFDDGYSKSGSTGSGLFLSKQILNKYGGKIILEHSTEENGTVFLIELHEG